jgi:hypothetical protein
MKLSKHLRRWPKSERAPTQLRELSQSGLTAIGQSSTLYKGRRSLLDGWPLSEAPIEDLPSVSYKASREAGVD